MSHELTPGETVVHLVRHAHAGSRQRWDGPDDSLRPLTDRGRREAEAIGQLLATTTRPDSVIVSSPYVRCVQTLEPLAALAGRDVAPDERLAESMPFEPMLDLVVHSPAGSVLCSHGDMIPEVVAALQRRGCEIEGEAHWEKGSTWTIVRREGRAVRAHAAPPPEV